MPTRRWADHERLLCQLGARGARESGHELRCERLPAPDPREFRREREYFFRGEPERTAKGAPARDGEAVGEQTHREAGEPWLVLVSHADEDFEVLAQCALRNAEARGRGPIGNGLIAVAL